MVLIIGEEDGLEMLMNNGFNVECVGHDMNQINQMKSKIIQYIINFQVIYHCKIWEK